jgi:heat shock protein HslJ
MGTTKASPRSAGGRFATALATAVLLALAGCGDDGDDTAEDEAAPVTEEDLDGRTFVSTEVEGETLVDGSEISLTFEDGTVGANAGCNNMSAGYTVADGTLEVAGPIAQTQMACPDDLQGQDTWIAEFLESGPTLALDGDQLTLSNAEVTIVATASDS